ncbi:helix-turn-helix transcriptional regulator [Candidatus Roizmanbacteria bacterium]|nr:helix-turn-helix transcriptional regulator [Candidatus Roizmanbacteria bacterium]
MDGIAHKIRYARRNKDLSQKVLGKLLGVTEMAISAYETGRAIPPLPTLKKISTITGFPLAYFTEEHDDTITLKRLHKDIQKIKRDSTTILSLLKKIYENKR